MKYISSKDDFVIFLDGLSWFWSKIDAATVQTLLGVVLGASITSLSTGLKARRDRKTETGRAAKTILAELDHNAKVCGNNIQSISADITAGLSNQEAAGALEMLNTGALDLAFSRDSFSSFGKSSISVDISVLITTINRLNAKIGYREDFRNGSGGLSNYLSKKTILNHELLGLCALTLVDLNKLAENIKKDVKPR